MLANHFHFFKPVYSICFKTYYDFIPFTRVEVDKSLLQDKNVESLIVIIVIVTSCTFSLRLLFVIIVPGILKTQKTKIS